MSDNSTKKQIILEAAARLFRDKGYSATSMRDLADAVQLKASSLYNHIASKEEILQTICFDNAHRFLAGMTEIEQLPVSATHKIEALIRLHIRIAREDLTSVTAFNDEWRHLSEPHLGNFKSLRKSYEGRFKSIIEAGIKAGELRPLHASVLLYTLFSSVRWLYDWYKPERNLSADLLESEIITILLNGMILK
ncbi:MAG: TetR/AcrR family transcriptional regulator [Saprospiraceae bacterium]|jgi:AcrR family transcriptional regulator|nr:TetR/AcrR family transcriptional regulator [Saprospiraceae bacterium]